MTDQQVALDTPNASIQALLHDKDLWLSQRTLATALGVSVKTVNEHLVALRSLLSGYASQQFSLLQTEGERSIRRDVLHCNLELAFAVAMRSRQYSVAKSLAENARLHGVIRASYAVPLRRETDFSELLSAALDGIATVSRQHPVGPYLVDFYLAEYNIAVEYDEEHHAAHQDRDTARQAFIEARLGTQVIRVPAGEDVQSLNKVLRALFAAV